METVWDRINRKLDRAIEQCDQIDLDFRGPVGMLQQIREDNRKIRRDTIIGGFILAVVIVWGFLHVASAVFS